MAVYTPVQDHDLETLLADYDLGSATALDPISAGVENTNYFLDTEKGRHVLTLFERRVNEADLPYFLSLTEHLAAHGSPCPKPRRRRDRPAAVHRVRDRQRKEPVFACLYK